MKDKGLFLWHFFSYYLLNRSRKIQEPENYPNHDFYGLFDSPLGIYSDTTWGHKGIGTVYQWFAPKIWSRGGNIFHPGPGGVYAIYSLVYGKFEPSYD